MMRRNTIDRSVPCNYLISRIVFKQMKLSKTNSYLILLGLLISLRVTSQDDTIQKPSFLCDTIFLREGDPIIAEILEFSISDLAYTPCNVDSLQINYISKKKISNLSYLRSKYEVNGNLKNAKNDTNLHVLGLHYNLTNFPDYLDGVNSFGIEYHRLIREKGVYTNYLLANIQIGMKAEQSPSIKEVTCVASSIGVSWKMNVGRLYFCPSVNVGHLYYFRLTKSFIPPDVFGPTIETKKHLFGLVPEFSAAFRISKHVFIQSSLNYGLYFDPKAQEKRTVFVSNKLPSIGFQFSF